ADLVPLRSYARSKGLKDEDIAFTASHKAIVNWAEVNNQFLVGETTFAAPEDVDKAIKAGFTSHEVRQAMVDVLLGRYGLSVDTNNWRIAVGAGDTSQAQAVLAKAARLKDAVGARAEWTQAVTNVHASVLGWVRNTVELKDADGLAAFAAKVSPLLKQGIWTADVTASGLDAEAKAIGEMLTAKGQPFLQGARDALFTLLTNPGNSEPDAVRVFVDQWKKFVAAADDLTKGTPIPYAPPALADDAIKGAFLQAQKDHAKQVLDTGENSATSLAIKQALDLVGEVTHLALDTDTQTELQQRKLGESSRYSTLVYTVLSSKPDTPLATLRSQLADYQAEMGLKVTGFMNDATLEQLVRDYLSQVLSAPSDMAAAQSALNDIYGAGLKEDGQAGFSTVSYLQRFQKEHHLWDSGQVDVTTLNLLRQEQAKLNTLGPFGSILRKDSPDASAARAIGTMQENLWRWKRQQLGLPIPALPTYTFDAVTEQMVKEFQRVHGLYQSGVVDRTLYEMITGKGQSTTEVPPVTASASTAWLTMPVANAQMTTEYGVQDALHGAGHTGIDLLPGGQQGDTTIRSAATGKVVFAGAAGNYGNLVVVDHGNGYLTYYGHLASIGVKEEQQVAAGKNLGIMGETGRATGVHLHFEVRRGNWDATITEKPWEQNGGENIVSPWLFLPVQGWGVNFRRLIEDKDFLDTSITKEQIAHVLDQAPTFAGRCRHFPVYDANGRQVGEVDLVDAVYQAAQANGINPLLLLARMQVEQSLLTRKYDPADPTLRWGLGNAADGGGRRDPKDAGLVKQIYGAAETLARLFKEAPDFTHGPVLRTGLNTLEKYPDGEGNMVLEANRTTSANIEQGDHVIIVPNQVGVENAATWALYAYTPHEINLYLLTGTRKTVVADSPDTYNNPLQKTIGGGNKLFFESWQLVQNLLR
ncbi:MAG TPA: peptidoglycan DD-metalloendopeptidase family protein, partial [Symbiobacteriaceae bacterium]